MAARDMAVDTTPMTVVINFDNTEEAGHRTKRLALTAAVITGGPMHGRHRTCNPLGKDPGILRHLVLPALEGAYLPRPQFTTQLAEILLVTTMDTTMDTTTTTSIKANRRIRAGGTTVMGHGAGEGNHRDQRTSIVEKL